MIGCFLISKELDATTAKLQKLAISLEDEKKKTDTLLYQMLPFKVANQLRDGKPVEAGKLSHLLTTLNHLKFRIEVRMFLGFYNFFIYIDTLLCEFVLFIFYSCSVYMVYP